jgi:hypothetical protein
MLLKYVIPITSTIADDSILVRIVIFLLILFYFYITDAFKKKYIPWSRYTFEISIFSFYIITKRITHPYTYYPTQSSCDYVLESFIVIVFVEIYLFIKYFLWKRKNKKRQYAQDTQIVPFYSDVPTDKDDFKRGKYAELLLNKIQATFMKTMEQSFTINLSEEYGYGKTSFFLLLKNKIKEDNRPFITIDFKPWLCEDADSILKEYFSLLKNRLKDYDNHLYKIIESYVKKLIDEFSPNTFIAFMKSLLSSTPISDEYEQIKSIISKKVDKPILIFIDDVDRLEKEELSALLKLIRNTADFPKLFYIIAADDTYLKDMLKAFGIQNPELYLKKFVNIDLLFPANDDILEKSLREAIRNLQISNEPKEMQEMVVEWSKNAFKNPRDIKRFLNKYTFIIDALKVGKRQIDKEVNYIDLFALVLIQYLQPKTYKILRDFNDLILDIGGFDQKYILNKKQNVRQIVFEDSTDQGAPTNKSNSPTSSPAEDVLIKRRKTKEEIVMSLLEYLFGDKDNYRSAERICQRNTYFRYFAADLKANQLTKSETLFILKINNIEEYKKEAINIINNDREDSFIDNVKYLSMNYPYSEKIDILQKFFLFVTQEYKKKEKYQQTFTEQHQSDVAFLRYQYISNQFYNVVSWLYAVEDEATEKDKEMIIQSTEILIIKKNIMHITEAESIYMLAGFLNVFSANMNYEDYIRYAVNKEKIQEWTNILWERFNSISIENNSNIPKYEILEILRAIT